MKAHHTSLVLVIVASIASSSLPVSASLVQLVSAADPALDNGTGGGGDSVTPLITPNGRYVLFASTANNLVAGTNETSAAMAFPARFNVFMRDRTDGTTALLSLNVTGMGGGNGDSLPMGISTNGRYALFETSASDLVLNDANQVMDVVVRDSVNGTNILISVGADGGVANGESRSPVMTPDGRFVAFVSAASNLVADDTNRIPDIFVRDLEQGTTVLATQGAIATNTFRSSSESPEISDDGRYVAFFSTATNLLPGMTTAGEIYVRDIVTSATLLASAGARPMLYAIAGTSNTVPCNYALSADGKFVAYMASHPTNRQSGIILRYSVETGGTDLVHTNARVRLGSPEEVRSLDITPDGRFIAFIANTRTNVGVGTVPSVCVWDAQTGHTNVASLDLENSVAAGSYDWPAIDPTGRFVGFTSTATNLTTNTLATGFQVYVRDLQMNQTSLAGVATNGAGFGVNAFALPRLSADGRFVTFQGFDPQSNPTNTRRTQNVFVHDRLNHTTELISARQLNLPGASAEGISVAENGSVSRSGRYVAFSSLAANMASNDTNANRDVFVRDLLNQTTILASLGTNGVSANGMSFEPAISSDGRFVAFTSTATDLVSGDGNNRRDVFVRDLQTQNLLLGSVATNGVGSGNNSSSNPFISANGRYLFFRSKASNLAAGSFTAGSENLFWRDLQTSSTVALTTSGLAGVAVTLDCRYAAYHASNVSMLYVWDSFAASRIYTNSGFTGVVLGIAPDGQRIAYAASGQIYVRDRVLSTTWLIGAVPASARLAVKFSGDGQFLAYSSSTAQGLTDANGTSDVYLYHIPTQTKTVVSRAYNLAKTANGASELPDISYDGRFLAYRSAATDLVPVDTNGWPDVFLFDRLTGMNRLLSVSVSGGSGNNRCYAAVFSGDGRTLVFPSWASDLSARDYNQAGDLFAFAFLYATIARGNGQPPVISWPANPGHNYLVQFKNNVNDPAWQTVAGTIVISGGRGALQDFSAGSATRIYRVTAY